MAIIRALLGFIFGYSMGGIFLRYFTTIDFVIIACAALAAYIASFNKV